MEHDEAIKDTISQLDISEMHARVGIKWNIYGTWQRNDDDFSSRFIAFLCLSFMNFAFYPDVRMYFWNVELAYTT